jgi:hypothetical protein
MCGIVNVRWGSEQEEGVNMSSDEESVDMRRALMRRVWT